MTIPFGRSLSSFAFVSVAVMSVGMCAVGCGSKTDGSGAAASASATAALPPGARGEEEGVTRYTSETPDTGGTHATMKNVTLRKSADNSSEIVGSVGKGTYVNLRARYGAFSLVEFPYGAPGQLKKGWLDNNDITPNTVAVTSATAAPLLPTTPTATTTPTTTPTGTTKPVPIIKPPVKRP
ncbi:MAG: hypothetical protein U0165_06735 [Polyangiaceae bacterium]